MFFVAIDEISDAYSKHVRSTDFDDRPLRSAVLTDPIFRHVQRTGLPTLDFPLNHIFTDPSVLARKLRTDQIDPTATAAQVARFVIHSLRCADLARRRDHILHDPNGHADVGYLVRADEILRGLTSSKRDRVVDLVKNAGFSPPPRPDPGGALIVTSTATVRVQEPNAL